MKYLITAALPYANGELHLGHPRSTYLPADVFSRYCKLRGKDSLFVCASDDHGTPIEINAEKQGKTPLELTQEYRKKHFKDLKDLGIIFDEFYYTDSKENHELASEFYLKLKKEGLIYEKEIEQNYCSKCNRALPDRYIKGKCPKCGASDQYGDNCEACGAVYTTIELKEAYCVVCKSKPVRKKSNHYFFALSKCKGFVDKYLEKELLQKDVVNYLKNWVKEGIQDWDITRDGPYFGIKIPEHEDKFFYVWFDAPIGYVSSTKKYCDDHSLNWKEYWTKDVKLIHFIGKDIQYFHYLFWPAMLYFAGYATPERMPTKGYLNLENEKMSKSRGNVLLIKDFLKDFPADYLRYYLTATTPNNTSDGNFLWKEFQSKVNSELIDNYGNYCYRVLSIIKTKANSVIPKPEVYSKEDSEFKEKILKISDEVAEEYEKPDAKRALEKIIAFSTECNKYFNNRAPWKLLKENEANTVLFLSAKAVLVLTALLNPIVPFTTEKISKQLNAEIKWGEYELNENALENVEIVLHKIEDEKIKSK
ncbi:MAG: methionine--tRNA ligase [Candidatus Micrarchaeota archaeon]